MTRFRRLCGGIAALLLSLAASADENAVTAADIFSPTALLEKTLQIEVALAQAQAANGVIPEAAAHEIAATATLDVIDEEAVSEERARVRHRMVGLLNVWRRSLSPEASGYLHYGATTVDIYDTARMMQVRASIDLFLKHLQDVDAELVALAQDHEETLMVGRTLGQHALPITFGKKVSVWIGELRRHQDRLRDLRGRVQRSAILKGAVGSHAGLGGAAITIEAQFAGALGFDTPYAADWHGSRDVFAEYAAVMGLLSRSLARLGQEVFLLQSSDIAEVVELRPPAAVGSSTMPHKRNPSLSEALIHRSRLITRLAEVIQDDMVNFFERDNTSRTNRLLGELSIEADAQLRDAVRLIGRLEVDTAAMRSNLDRTQGLIMAQRIVFALAPDVGKARAEEHIRTLAARALAEGVRFREVLVNDPLVATHLSPEAITALLDPAGYVDGAKHHLSAVIADDHHASQRLAHGE